MSQNKGEVKKGTPCREKSIELLNNDSIFFSWLNYSKVKKQGPKRHKPWPIQKFKEFKTIEDNAVSQSVSQKVSENVRNFQKFSKNFRKIQKFSEIFRKFQKVLKTSENFRKL